MFTELVSGERARVRDLYAGLDQHLALHSVIEGTNPGRVYADRTENPRAAFIVSTEGSYLAGDPGIEAFNQGAAEVIGGMMASGSGALWLDADPDSWDAKVPELLGGRMPIRLARRHYTCTALAHDWRSRLPGGYEVRRIDAELLADRTMSVPEHLRGWIATNWGTTEAFLHIGFGFCTLHGTEMVSWCIADCVSGNRCEVGIQTAEAHRRRGLAAITAAAAVEHALSAPYAQAGWHCDEENVGSWKTAERVGFVHDRHYTFFQCIFDEAEHQAELSRRSQYAGGGVEP